MNNKRKKRIIDNNNSNNNNIKIYIQIYINKIKMFINKKIIKFN